MQASGVSTGYPTRHADAAAPPKMRPGGASAVLVALGCLALAVGLLVYMADRDATRVWLLPQGAVLHGGPLFGVLGAWLPAFVHPFAFSLFSAATLQRKAAPAYGACAAWRSACARPAPNWPRPTRKTWPRRAPPAWPSRWSTA